MPGSTAFSSVLEDDVLNAGPDELDVVGVGGAGDVEVDGLGGVVVEGEEPVDEVADAAVEADVTVVVLELGDGRDLGLAPTFLANRSFLLRKSMMSVFSK